MVHGAWWAPPLLRRTKSIRPCRHPSEGICASPWGSFSLAPWTSLLYGKEVGVALPPWDLGVPSAATAVSERLGTAGSNEFGGQGGHRDLQDEQLGLGARTCASPIPVSSSGALGPSSTRSSSTRVAVMSKRTSLEFSSVCCSSAAAGGIGGGRSAASPNPGGEGKVFVTHLSAGIGATGNLSCRSSLGSSACVWVPVLWLRSSLAGS